MCPVELKSPITASQMRNLEADAIGSGRVTGLQLMERAGAGVVNALENARSAQVGGHACAVVLCGPGNNGGDGYVVARLLAERGWRVAVFALGDPQRLPPDALQNCLAWKKISSIGALDAAPRALPQADVVVDGLFGIGLARPLEAAVVQVLDAIPETAHRVAIDVPSGWATDGEGILGNGAFIADQVVTFHMRKPVHEALSKNGVRVDVVDIGL